MIGDFSAISSRRISFSTYFYAVGSFLFAAVLAARNIGPTGRNDLFKLISISICRLARSAQHLYGTPQIPTLGRGVYTKCLNLTSRRRHAHQRVVLGVNNTMAHSLHHVHARTHAKSTNLGPNFFYENRHGTCMHRSDRREPSKRRPVTPPGGSSGSLAAYASQPPHRPPSAAFRGRSRL